MSRKTKEAVQGVIYILPSFVLILIFCIIPIFMSGYFSFTEYNIMNSPKFVGLDNYIKMFKDSLCDRCSKKYSAVCSYDCSGTDDSGTGICSFSGSKDTE